MSVKRQRSVFNFGRKGDKMDDDSTNVLALIADFLADKPHKRELYFWRGEYPQLHIPKGKVVKVEISFESEAKLQNLPEVG
jgi:hypothetical protein